MFSTVLVILFVLISSHLPKNINIQILVITLFAMIESEEQRGFFFSIFYYGDFPYIKYLLWRNYLSSHYRSAENSFESLSGQTVHQNEKSSGPPEKLAVHITSITKIVTEHSWLIVLNLWIVTVKI